MYYCNCVKSLKASGQTPSKWTLDQGFSDFYFLVPVCKEKTCTYCGYSAIYSKIPLGSQPQQAAANE